MANKCTEVFLKNISPMEIEQDLHQLKEDPTFENNVIYIKEEPPFEDTDDYGEEVEKTIIKTEEDSNFIKTEEYLENSLDGVLDKDGPHGSGTIPTCQSIKIEDVPLEVKEEVLIDGNSEEKDKLNGKNTDCTTKRTAFPCTQCHKQLSSKLHLIQHMMIHTGLKPHHCTQCDKQFARKSHLIQHMMIHTGLKPHHCSQCDKQFMAKVNLIQHENIHSGLKPQHCSQCEKQFNIKSNLIRHMMIHTGLKPHHCTQCDKQFKTKSNLNRHVKIHTLPK